MLHGLPFVGLSEDADVGYSVFSVSASDFVGGIDSSNPDVTPPTEFTMIAYRGRTNVTELLFDSGSQTCRESCNIVTVNTVHPYNQTHIDVNVTATRNNKATTVTTMVIVFCFYCLI